MPLPRLAPDSGNPTRHHESSGANRLAKEPGFHFWNRSKAQAPEGPKLRRLLASLAGGGKRTR
ncbi:hypothetical protein NXC14_CH04039 [Rhizobium sp. NXC14]|nr:hypothetical protein NXC14_CH04039 [Rhizobium sp. NXC14]